MKVDEVGSYKILLSDRFLRSLLKLSEDMKRQPKDCRLEAKL